MPIHYRIEENTLKPGTYYARVISGDNVSLDQMIVNIGAKTSLTGSDVKSVIIALTNEVIIALAAGNTAMIDGLVSFKTSLSGSLYTSDFTITKSNAHLNINVQEDHALQAAVASQASYNQEVVDIKTPILKNFFDVAAHKYDCYTPGSIIRIEGNHLKFNANADDEGVFIINAAGETRLTVYSVIGNKQIDGLIPASVTDDFTLMVRTRYTEKGELRHSSYHKKIVPARNIGNT